tara:strand:- start:351 stop:614 length:264 start_codon:yes stop_codon:yes gene_type:complete
MNLTRQHVRLLMVDQVVVDQLEKQLLVDQETLLQQVLLKVIMVEQHYQETLCHVREQVVVEVELLQLEQVQLLLVVEQVELVRLTQF